MKYRQKKPGFLETIVISIGHGLWFSISWPFKKLLGIGRPKKFDKVRNLELWLEIEKLLDSGDKIHAEQAVIRADKFFDAQLKHGGAKGRTFADRLRDWENHFNSNTYQMVWQAHKLRNQITHNEEHSASISECKSALEKFRKGLRNIGAL